MTGKPRFLSKRKQLEMEAFVRPLVFRGEKGPQRELYVRTTLGDKLFPAEGQLHGTYGGEKILRYLAPEYHTSRGYSLPLPEPKAAESKKLALRFEAAVGKTIACEKLRAGA